MKSLGFQQDLHPKGSTGVEAGSGGGSPVGEQHAQRHRVDPGLEAMEAMEGWGRGMGSGGGWDGCTLRTHGKVWEWRGGQPMEGLTGRLWAQTLSLVSPNR